MRELECLFLSILSTGELISLQGRERECEKQSAGTVVLHAGCGFARVFRFVSTAAAFRVHVKDFIIPDSTVCSNAWGQGVCLREENEREDSLAPKKRPFSKAHTTSSDITFLIKRSHVIVLLSASFKNYFLIKRNHVIALLPASFKIAFPIKRISCDWDTPSN